MESREEKRRFVADKKFLQALKINRTMSKLAEKHEQMAGDRQTNHERASSLSKEKYHNSSLVSLFVLPTFVVLPLVVLLVLLIASKMTFIYKLACGVLALTSLVTYFVQVQNLNDNRLRSIPRQIEEYMDTNHLGLTTMSRATEVTDIPTASRTERLHPLKSTPSVTSL